MNMNTETKTCDNCDKPIEGENYAGCCSVKCKDEQTADRVKRENVGGVFGGRQIL